jgi:hypothetical protein
LLIGDVLFGEFHLDGNGVYQALASWGLY